MLVGLTGGIGSGKTTVLNLFKNLGAIIYSADIEAKNIMHANDEVIASIKELFGTKAYVGEKLNRAYISDLVFNDKSLLEKLNAIIHPAVSKHFENFVKTHQDHYIVYESALLLQNANQKRFNYVVLIVADDEERIKRVMHRDGISREKVLFRMNNQWSQEKSKPLADFIIENKDKEQLVNKVEELHKFFIEQYIK